MEFLGLGKTLFNSSACMLKGPPGRLEVELILSERILRKKAAGDWPEAAIRTIGSKFNPERGQILENRDFISSLEYDRLLDRGFPFLEYLKARGLHHYSAALNPGVRLLTHHHCHAAACTLLSPFERSIILIMDGAGSSAGDFRRESDEISRHGPSHDAVSAHEEFSVYLQEGARLTCARKGWQTFRKSSAHRNHSFSGGLGALYEKSSEYIFNCKRSAGKVMGLAAFGSCSQNEISGRQEYLEALDWTRAFSGRGKREWEASGRFGHFAELAATVQAHFENSYISLVRELRGAFPDFRNLVLAGGCALNCTTNMKLIDSGLFDQIYVPPFPGDESIGFGAAAAGLLNEFPEAWTPVSHECQHGYFGPESSAPRDLRTERVFEGFKLVKPASIVAHAAERLERGEIIAWFQGRSESGPRALGNRSILARPDRPGLKDHLNAQIKFREAFRPYGCSCLHERAHEYFVVPAGFNNPFMSFAVKVRPTLAERLKEVTHFDGTSRMQTVRRGQNALFHELIHEFGKRTGLFCLLNTSLNVMGEPIVETVEDARRFLERTPVDGIAIGNLFVERQR